MEAGRMAVMDNEMETVQETECREADSLAQHGYLMPLIIILVIFSILSTATTIMPLMQKVFSLTYQVQDHYSRL